MKKLLLIMCAVIFIFNIYSCDKTGNDLTDTIETSKEITSSEFIPYKYGIVAGDYIFDYSSRGYPMKYNVHTGKASYICPDPFCNHMTKNCQFYRVGSYSFTSVGNVVYYVKQDETTGKSTLNSFDVDTSETKTVFSRDGLMTSVYAYENRLLILWIEKFGLEAKRFYFWYDTVTGDTEQLNGTVNTYQPTERYMLSFVRDDRIIWKVGNMKNWNYYSTDLMGEDLKEYDAGYIYGNYYKMEKETDENGNDMYSLYVTYENGEKKILKKNVGSCLFYENKIVYGEIIPEEEQRIVYADKDGYVVRDDWGGNVYVMNPDGSDDHLLFHTDEFITGMTADDAHPHVCGDYIGIQTGKFKGDQMMEDDIIIVNLNTGEFVVTHK